MTIVILQRIEFKIENVAKEKEMKYYNYLKLIPSGRSKTYNDLHIYICNNRAPKYSSQN